MAEQQVECVLFDLDGTLIDTIDLIVESFQHAVRTHLGIEVSREYVEATIGRPLGECLDELAPGRGDELLRTYREYNLTYHDSRVRLYPGVLETLEQLQRDGRKTGIVTSKSRLVTSRAVDLYRFDQLMDLIICLDDCPRPKPHPEPVLLAVGRLAADPARTLYVGDSIFDVQCGRAAGVWTAAALWGAGRREALVQARPDFLVEQPPEVLGICNGAVGNGRVQMPVGSASDAGD